MRIYNRTAPICLIIDAAGGGPIRHHTPAELPTHLSSELTVSARESYSEQTDINISR